jgi:hypothetical protein
MMDERMFHIHRKDFVIKLNQQSKLPKDQSTMYAHDILSSNGDSAIPRLDALESRV